MDGFVVVFVRHKQAATNDLLNQKLHVFLQTIRQIPQVTFNIFTVFDRRCHGRQRLNDVAETNVEVNVSTDE